MFLARRKLNGKKDPLWDLSILNFVKFNFQGIRIPHRKDVVLNTLDISDINGIPIIWSGCFYAF